MSEDDRKQEKMQVLYDLEEVRVEMGCVKSKLLGAATVYQQIGERLPRFVNPERPGMTPGTPRIDPFPEPRELSALVERLDRLRSEEQALESRKGMLYPAQGVR